MKLHDDKRQQLIDLAAHLHDVAGRESVSPDTWRRLQVDIEEDAVFLETFIIPKIEATPNYISGNGGVKLATYEPAPLTDARELHERDAVEGTGKPFLAS